MDRLNATPLNRSFCDTYSLIFRNIRLFQGFEGYKYASVYCICSLQMVKKIYSTLRKNNLIRAQMSWLSHTEMWIKLNSEKLVITPQYSRASTQVTEDLLSIPIKISFNRPASNAMCQKNLSLHVDRKLCRSRFVI